MKLQQERMAAELHTEREMAGRQQEVGARQKAALQGDVVVQQQALASMAQQLAEARHAAEQLRVEGERLQRQNTELADKLQVQVCGWRWGGLRALWPWLMACAHPAWGIGDRDRI